MANARFSKRLTKELADLQKNQTAGIALQQADSLDKWLVKIFGAPNTLYSGEEFVLQFRFSQQYPLESPEVMFVGAVPTHPHIYSNGHICLSILSDGWTPALTVQSVALSILSMLSSCQKKESPPDNDRYVQRSVGKSPKSTNWFLHDDTV